MVSHWLSMCLPIYLSVYHSLSVRISFLDENLSKCEWIFTKLGICIDIVKIWFGIVNGQIYVSFGQSYMPATCPSFRFWMITRINIGFIKLGICIDIEEVLTELSACSTSIFLFSDVNLCKIQGIIT